MKLSVIIPVYNEKDTVRDMVDRVRRVPEVFRIIISDDGSDDGTAEVLRGMDTGTAVCLLNDTNRGKGHAVRTAIPVIEGDAAVIQDADNEYDPAELSAMAARMEQEGLDVLYGSRYLRKNRSLSGRQWLANWFLSGLTNVLFGSRLTDMETCYKMMRREVWQGLRLTADRFDIEPEITARVLQAGYTIHEVPISYNPRDYTHGKKIGWRDAVAAVAMLLKCRLSR